MFVMRVKIRLLKLALKKLFKKDFKLLFPLCYVFFLLIGAVLFLLFQVFPSLIYCSNIFGVKFCTPIGAFLALVVSLPGYFIAGNVLGITPKTPLSFSIPVVIGLSAFFYYILGITADLVKKIKLKTRDFSKVLVVVIFIALLIFYLALR